MFTHLHPYKVTYNSLSFNLKHSYIPTHLNNCILCVTVVYTSFTYLICINIFTNVTWWVFFKPQSHYSSSFPCTLINRNNLPQDHEMCPHVESSPPSLLQHLHATNWKFTILIYNSMIVMHSWLSTYEAWFKAKNTYKTSRLTSYLCLRYTPHIKAQTLH